MRVKLYSHLLDQKKHARRTCVYSYVGPCSEVFGSSHKIRAKSQVQYQQNLPPCRSCQGYGMQYVLRHSELSRLEHFHKCSPAKIYTIPDLGRRRKDLNCRFEYMHPLCESVPLLSHCKYSNLLPSLPIKIPNYIKAYHHLFMKASLQHIQCD